MSDLDLSNVDDVYDIDWSDVEAELAQNRDMLKEEAGIPLDGGGGGDEMDAFAALAGGGGGSDGGSSLSSPDEVGMEFIMEIPLQLRVEVGTATLLVKDLLDIDNNSIIELKKKVGTPMDVFINEKLVAKGEIVVQHEKFGLKIIDILDQDGRISSLSSM